MGIGSMAKVFHHEKIFISTVSKGNGLSGIKDSVLDENVNTENLMSEMMEEAVDALPAGVEVYDIDFKFVNQHFGVTIFCIAKGKLVSEDSNADL